MTKGAWWRNDEDLLLVQAYLLVNKNEKVGINQDYKPFWQRVLKEFEKGGNDKNRTPEGRWEIISAQIARYAAAVAFIERAIKKNSASSKSTTAKLKHATRTTRSPWMARRMCNKKAKALKRRHAEDDDLESLAGEQLKLACLEVVEEEKRRRLLEEMLEEAQKANEEARLVREEAIMSKDLDSLSPAQNGTTRRSNRRSLIE
ncbi:hypothetical protein BDB00DRAFT_873692 [Zychaea mexicana]|uniref:uncharacterized protein n=1 Tax=Zychaea mexicana TaxID=64656 RepID=UPI0022FEBC71|nr:uncharacterized protein BDB00DRAFT_873692 [Zychaea mexicana]KAI9492041.1 hypothetical protein BDB00DRAFT_873692 [Zychaea mexicana]